MKKYCFIVVVMVLTGCTDHDVVESVVGIYTGQALSGEFDALIEKARWGDTGAYVKLADCYREGKGVKKDFVKMMGMVSFANELGAINVVNQYMDSLPDDSEFRLFFDAICKIEEKQVDEARDIADRLVSVGSPDGLVLKGIMALEQDDSIEANRYFVIAKEQGNDLAELLLCVPDWREPSNPNEKKLSSLADTNPVACFLLADHYSGRRGEYSKNERLAAYYYMKADEKAFLSKEGAKWLLDYYRNGGDVQLTEQDVMRLQKLSGIRSLHDIE